MSNLSVLRAATYNSGASLVGPRDYITAITEMTGIGGWWSLVTNQVTVISSEVSEIANRVSGGTAMTQGNAAVRAPMADDTVIGRPALAFDAVAADQYAAGTWNPQNPYTLCALCKPTIDSDRMVFGAYGTGADIVGIRFVNTSPPQMRFWGGGGALVVANSDIASDQWVSVIAARASDNTLNVMINGKTYAGSAITGAPNSSSTIRISSSLRFKGNIAEVGFFENRDLFASGNEADLATVNAFLEQTRTALDD